MKFNSYTILRDTRDPHPTWDNPDNRPRQGWILQERKWREIVYHFERADEMLLFISSGHRLTDCHHWSFWQASTPERVYVIQTGEVFQNCQDKLCYYEIQSAGRIPQTITSKGAES